MRYLKLIVRVPGGVRDSHLEKSGHNRVTMKEDICTGTSRRQMLKNNNIAPLQSVDPEDILKNLHGSLIWGHTYFQLLMKIFLSPIRKLK